MGDEEIEERSEIDDVFAEAQGMVPVEDTLDFDYSVRDKEVAPESPEAQIGKWVHAHPELFSEELSAPIPDHDQVDKEVTIESPYGQGIADVRADRVDWETSTVYEIKPNNKEAIEQGQGQANVAAERLTESTGKEFGTQVVAYDRDQLLEKHPWMKAAYPTEETIESDLSTTFEPANDDDYAVDLSSPFEVADLDDSVDLSTDWSASIDTSIDASVDTDMDAGGFDSGGFDGDGM